MIKEYILDRKIHTHNHVMSTLYKKLMIKKLKALLKEAIVLALVCSLISILSYFTFYYSDIHGKMPPEVSEYNQEQFVNKYVMSIHNSDFGGTWYRILELPKNLVGEWEYDSHLLNMQFSRTDQIDVNKVRMELYYWNSKQAKRACCRTTLWIWLFGIIGFFTLKIGKRIGQWNQNYEYY